MRRSVVAVATLGCLSCLGAFASAQRTVDSPGPPANPLIRLLDGDADGKLSPGEIDAASAKIRALDTSQDGEVTADELGRLFPRDRRSRGPGGPPQNASDNELQKDLIPKDAAEQQVLSTLQAMWQGERYLNVSPTDGRLLRLLCESIGAKQVVEIGTSTGESAVWLALALKSTGGKLITHEIDPGRASIARQNLEKAGVDDIVTVVVGDAHETVKQHTDPIDILFLDADKEGYIDYLNKLMPLIRPGGLIVAHNMNSRQADPRFVKAITEDPQLETLILLKEGTGVGVTLKKH